MKTSKILLISLIICLATPQITYAQDYQPDSLSLRVYSDGSVDVEYIINPDITLAQVNVTLFGEGYQNLLAIDPDGIILDWIAIQGGIMVDSLGSTSITITYTTDTLTNKDGSQWSIQVESPINALYTLPRDAVLTGLNPTPLGISIVDNQASITMPVGVSSISYLLGTTGTQEHALVLLNTAKSDVNEVKSKGIFVDEAETLLNQAIQAYQAELFAQSEQLSIEASQSARETETLAVSALDQINLVKSLLESRRDEINDVTLTEAGNLITLAETQYEDGEYAEALDGAENVYELVLNSPTREQSGNNNLMYIGLVAVLAFIGGGYWYIKQRGDIVIQKPDTPQREVDLDKVFKKHPRLRTDDKAVLLHLHEKGGLFMTEIREHFDIPKSSAWRMIRRLEEDGIIITSKVGRETYIQLKGEEEE